MVASWPEKTTYNQVRPHPESFYSLQLPHSCNNPGFPHCYESLKTPALQSRMASFPPGKLSYVSKTFPDESHGTTQPRGQQNAEGGVLAKVHCLGITGIPHNFPLRWGWFGCGLVTVPFSRVRPNLLCHFSSPSTWDCPGAPCSPSVSLCWAQKDHLPCTRAPLGPWKLQLDHLCFIPSDCNVKTKCPQKATESEKYVFPAFYMLKKMYFHIFLPITLVRCEFYHYNFMFLLGNSVDRQGPAALLNINTSPSCCVKPWLYVFFPNIFFFPNGNASSWAQSENMKIDF